MIDMGLPVTGHPHPRPAAAGPPLNPRMPSRASCDQSCASGKPLVALPGGARDGGVAVLRSARSARRASQAGVTEFSDGLAQPRPAPP